MQMLLGPPSPLAQPTRNTVTGPLEQGVDAARGLPLPSAITLVEAEYSLRAASGAAAGAVRIRNVTVWCGASWGAAEPVAAAAVRAAAAQLPVPAGSQSAPAAPPPPPPSGASDDSRNFLIGTLAVACVGAQHPRFHKRVHHSAASFLFTHSWRPRVGGDPSGGTPLPATPSPSPCRISHWKRSRARGGSVLPVTGATSCRPTEFRHACSRTRRDRRHVLRHAPPPRMWRPAAGPARVSADVDEPPGESDTRLPGLVDPQRRRAAGRLQGALEPELLHGPELRADRAAVGQRVVREPRGAAKLAVAAGEHKGRCSVQPAAAQQPRRGDV